MSQDCCCAASAGNAKQTPAVATALSFQDMLGAWKVRWGIGRLDYKVAPGLYAVGQPDSEAVVLVSANYKLTFDTLRKNLAGLDCWLLILDTKGVNVWCAAGKGTFGTSELVKRLKATRLAEIVTHRRLILPQLSASGISAPRIERITGFSVLYGPVRANDIKAFLTAGCQASADMRRVKFTLRDRLVLTPMELVPALKISLFMLGVLFLLNLFAARPFNAFDLAVYAGAVLTGTVLTPVLLPWIPGKAFAWKGWLLGLAWTALALWLFGWYAVGHRWLATGYLLLLPALSAYLALNFTGSSTYTSPSGVLQEMKTALPLIAVSSLIGTVLVLITHLFI